MPERYAESKFTRLWRACLKGMLSRSLPATPEASKPMEGVLSKTFNTLVASSKYIQCKSGILPKNIDRPFDKRIKTGKMPVLHLRTKYKKGESDYEMFNV